MSLVLCFGFANYYFSTSHQEWQYIYEGVTNFNLLAVAAGTTYFLIFNTLIPLTMIVALEISKLF